MRQTPKLLVALLLVFLVVTGIACSPIGDQSDQQLKGRTVRQLERQIFEIDSELPRLPEFSLRSGVGTIGYRSQIHGDAADAEWIQIELERKCTVDDIILVPCLLRRAEAGFSDEGFPIEFRIVVGSKSDDEGHEIASFNADDHLLPRIAPLVIPAGGIEASWIRIEALRLTPRQFDGKFIFQMAEILVFSGQENVALRQSVTASSNKPFGSPGWAASFVNDGFVPYLMDGPTGAGSLAYVSAVGIGDEPTLTIDLKSVQRVSQVNLHLVDQSDTVPQTFTGDFGMPGKLRIEGASQPDFSDGKLLVELEHKNFFDTGPIIIRRFPESSCRYVRLTGIDPYLYSFGADKGTRIGFAEIELRSNGHNVTHGKAVQASFETGGVRTLVALTDGNNYYGQILPVRQWLTALARRHDLESERPRIAAELISRYVKQKTLITQGIVLAGFVAAFTLIAGWILRQRVVTATRERIAADLHDELGANFHAIGLLSDLAKANADAPKKLKPLLARMRDLTERTGTAAIYCANMLESKGLYDDLVEDLRRSSARTMFDLNHEIEIEGVDHLQALSPRKRIDLFLFHKECLINIIRHSGATSATTRLKANQRLVLLTVSDNGIGLDEVNESGAPPSLRRRARLLGGSVSVTEGDTGGTCVTLRLPRSRISYWLGLVRGKKS